MDKEIRFIKYIIRVCKKAQDYPLTMLVSTESFAQRIIEEFLLYDFEWSEEVGL